MRHVSGSRNIIESSMKEKIRTKNRRLEDLFEVKECNFITVHEASNSRENYDHRLVICSNLEEIVEKIIDERKIREEEILIRIGMEVVVS